ncbi:HCL384Wp [Eremothecium sinecaudum]|uniref:HCL384Wp n=1 Tax=Eremothecium sinecaudum TaxID=45286 RepID=A0A109UYP9_9SACH|nr:HCL384Wp [Eremothecium sinecaudum]AMD19767.1 HCL384Wp [Eremothecium sinecaudum]
MKTDNIIIRSNFGEQKFERSQQEGVEESLKLIEDLKFFLATAPANWQENQVIRRYYLNNDEGFVSCVFWNNLYYITGTDIVRCCVYRMQKFGREVVERKKFEEGIFSDLRNLKCGVDATLEMPKSDFLSFLYKNLCLKTQKKQKVFFWFSVPHDKLFADALERDLRRESSGQPSATRAVSEPALTFRYDEESGTSLYDQVVQHVDSERINVYSAASSSAAVPADAANDEEVHDDDEDEDEEGDDDEIDDKGALPMDLLSKRGETGPSAKIQMDEDISRTEPELSTIATDNNVSTAPTAHYSPHELIIDGAKNENTEYTLDDSINLLTKDDDDFPLDYFPLEIEYPRREQQNRMMNPLFHDMDMDLFPPIPPTAGVYESPYIHGDLSGKFMYSAGMPPSAGVPPTLQQSLPSSIPPPPMSVTRAHFMTNGEYYATAKSKDSNKESRDLYDEENNESSQDSSDGMNEAGDEQFTQPMNSRNVGNGQPPGMGNVSGFPFQDSFAGYQGMGPPGMYPYMMPDMMYGNPYAGADDYMYEQWLHMQLAQNQQNEMYMNPQAPYMSRFLPPLCRTTPTNPYMAISPYQSKHPNSSTTKNFPYYPGYYGRRGNVHSYLRGFPSIQATQPSSATRVQFMKQNKVQQPNNAPYTNPATSSANKSAHSTKKKVMKPKHQQQSMKNYARTRRLDADTPISLDPSNSNIGVINNLNGGNQEERIVGPDDAGSTMGFQNDESEA